MFGSADVDTRGQADLMFGEAQTAREAQLDRPDRPAFSPASSVNRSLGLPAATPVSETLRAEGVRAGP